MLKGLHVSHKAFGYLLGHHWQSSDSGCVELASQDTGEGVMVNLTSRYRLLRACQYPGSSNEKWAVLFAGGESLVEDHLGKV